MATFEKCYKSGCGGLHLYLFLVKSTDKPIIIISVGCVLRLHCGGCLHCLTRLVYTPIYLGTPTYTRHF